MAKRLEQIAIAPSMCGSTDSEKFSNVQYVLDELYGEHHFQLQSHDYDGKYRVELDSSNSNLLIAVFSTDQHLIDTVILPILPIRKIMKDYRIICDSYQQAINASYNPSKIEAIDMGRRGLHNEGAEIVMDMLVEKIEMDFETARKFFTLCYILFSR